MNASEVREWISYQAASDPGWWGWIEKNYPEGMGKPNRRQFVEFCERDFEHVELADAKLATDAMRVGDLEQPRGFSGLIRAIVGFCLERQHARAEAAPRRFGGERGYRCRLCHDDGYAAVWDRISMAAYRTGRFGEPFTAYRVAVPCECEAGNERRRLESARLKCAISEVPQYHPDRWCLWDDADRDDRREAFRDWMETHPGAGAGETVHVAPYTEFAEFA